MSSAGQDASPGGATESSPRASFQPSELIVVASHYDLGVIESAREFRRGSRRSPKVLLQTRMGRFVLKRRAPGRDDPGRIALSHAIQRHLAGRGYPLPRLISTKTTGDTILHLDSGSYEMFEYIEGSGYDQSLASTFQAGQALALFHRLLADFQSPVEPPTGAYHASDAIDTHLKRIARQGADPALREPIDQLRGAYARASELAEKAGLSSWPLQIIHGDWHPGNLLYQGGKIVAAIDYDTTRLGQRVLDVANGALQFSVTREKGPPEAWPDYLDESRLRRFCRGYDAVEGCVISAREIEALPSLMIEALIAESAIPIATTGRFANIEGGEFLRMVERKVAWLGREGPRIIKSLG